MARNRTNQSGDPDPDFGFHPMVVGKCHAQTATDRFGPEADEVITKREQVLTGQAWANSILSPYEPLNWPDVHRDIDEEEGGPPTIFREVPTPQGNRNNLTALSDVYPLYFAAYQNRVFVYRPEQGAQSKLRREPDLQLRADSSLEAQQVGGYIDHRGRGRSINHMITGFLGTEEILVHCADNGDVVAYYTKDIATCVFHKTATSKAPSGKRGLRQEKRGLPKVLPFFSANVLKTAWGLDIHQKSRLIAVSSNRAEVTVFAFAMAPDPLSKSEGKRLKEPKDDVESWVRQRRRNWKIVIGLPKRAENIPNVCFLESEHGLAEKVCAVDIAGALWIANIWKPFRAVTHIPATKDPDFVSQEFYPNSSRGWGVVGLRESHFMKVDNVDELLGMTAHRCDFKQPTSKYIKHPEGPSLKIDLSLSLESVPGNPCRPSKCVRGTGRHPRFVPMGHWPAPGFDTDSDDEDMVEPEEVPEGELGEQLGEQPEEESEELSEDDDWEESLTEEGLEEEEEGSSSESDEGLQDGFNEGYQQHVDLNGLVENNPPVGHNGTAMPISQYPAPPPANANTNWDLLNNLGAPFYETFANLMQSVELMNEAFEGLEGVMGHQGDAPAAWAALEAGPRSRSVPQPREHTGRSWNTSHISTALLDMVYYPDKGLAEQAPMDRISRTEYARHADDLAGDDAVKEKYDQGSDGLAREYRLLRSFEKDFELLRIPDDRTKDWGEIGVVCSNAACCKNFWDNTSRYFGATSRLSMLAHIPELAVVILGSPTGRILLMTPTRLRAPEPHLDTGWEWNHGMRVECVLPRESDEEICRPHNVARPLYGLAVGRVPEVGDGSGEDGRGSADLPRRYRIMLHYQNHLILSYELTRQGQAKKLCIF